jgi:UDP-GlcNAc3NAcA epimerase
VHMVGDVMADALAFAVERARDRSDILTHLALRHKGFLLATVHRAENTDDPTRLRSILDAFSQIDEPVIFPIHPRTRKALESLNGIAAQSSNLRFIEPVGYLDMVRLEQAARMILTDSGGIQKEAYWVGVPCVTLRDETEWVETVEAGWNTLAGAHTSGILQAVGNFQPPAERPHLYGDGRAAERCIALMKNAAIE